MQKMALNLARYGTAMEARCMVLISQDQLSIRRWSTSFNSTQKTPHKLNGFGYQVHRGNVTKLKPEKITAIAQLQELSTANCPTLFFMELKMSFLRSEYRERLHVPYVENCRPRQR